VGQISYKIEEIRNYLNKQNMITDIALCVQDDLKNEGYDTELVKHNPKKTSTWKIIPKNLNMTKEQMEEFEKKKQQATDYWVRIMKENLHEYKRTLLK